VPISRACVTILTAISYPHVRADHALFSPSCVLFRQNRRLVRVSL
jgi:hypothetical protein